MVRFVSGRPILPSPPRGLPIEITSWASSLVKVLTEILAETNTAVNQIISQGGRPAFSAFLGTNQTGVGLSTWTTVDIDTEEFDTDAAFDTATSKFTPLIPGKYLLSGAVSFLSLADGSFGAIRILKNGASKQGNILRTGSGGTLTPVVSVIFEADGVADSFRLQAFQNDSASETIQSGSILTYFQGTRLGP